MSFGAIHTLRLCLRFLWNTRFASEFDTKVPIRYQVLPLLLGIGYIDGLSVKRGRGMSH
jgi:hypothetical protein